MTFNIFCIIVYNIGRMKKIKSSVVLLVISSILLTACDVEKRSFCLDTSTLLDYVEGKCAVVSPKDINETIYVYCSQRTEKNDNFVMTWGEVLSPAYFAFTGGLEGKKVDSAVFVTNNTLKVSLHGLCRDEKATSGYIQVKNIAIVSHSEETKDATLYGYIAIGEQTGDIDKPANFTY